MEFLSDDFSQIMQAGGRRIETKNCTTIDTASCQRQERFDVGKVFGTQATFH